MHLDKLHNSKGSFIHFLDLLKMYTFYKIQNKLEQELPIEEKNLISAVGKYKERMG